MKWRIYKINEYKFGSENIFTFIFEGNKSNQFYRALFADKTLCIHNSFKVIREKFFHKTKILHRIHWKKMIKRKTKKNGLLQQGNLVPKKARKRAEVEMRILSKPWNRARTWYDRPLYFLFVFFIFVPKSVSIFYQKKVWEKEMADFFLQLMSPISLSE